MQGILPVISHHFTSMDQTKEIEALVRKTLPTFIILELLAPHYTMRTLDFVTQIGKKQSTCSLKRLNPTSDKYWQNMQTLTTVLQFYL